METSDRRLLTKNSLYLNDALEVNPVCTYLLAKEIFQPDHIDQIKTQPTPKEQRTKLWEILITRGPRAFKAFGEALEETKQRPLATLLKRPRAAQIVRLDDNHSPVLCETALEDILADIRIADMKVMIVSVAGAARKGKSFLLNIFLRYLYFLCSDTVEKGEWLESGRLEGFVSQSGVDPVTDGIWLWTEPFILSLPEERKVGVLLMDSQGTWDHMSTVKDCTTVFALSTMLSSVQIFNVSNNPKEDDLANLLLFASFGRQCVEEKAKEDIASNPSRASGKPFQCLQMLVRDWFHPTTHSYGFEGGRELLNSLLEVTHTELQQNREDIDHCFDDIQCFLMPHPGKKVAINRAGSKFTGAVKDIEEEFKQQMKIFVPGIFGLDKLVVKKINNEEIRSIDLLEYFRARAEADKQAKESHEKAKVDAERLEREANEQAQAKAAVLADQLRQLAIATAQERETQARNRAADEAAKFETDSRARSAEEALRLEIEGRKRAAAESERIDKEARATAQATMDEATARVMAIYKPNWFERNIGGYW